MVSHKFFLSLVLPWTVAAIGLDVGSQDSVKSVAKTLASAIVAAYNSQPDPRTPGLFQSPYFWWESGVVFNGLIEYSHLTGDAQFNDLVSAAIQWQIGDNNAFMPANQTKTLGNDDQSFWGFTALTAAEVGFPKPKTGEWIDLAKNVFDTQAFRWDEKTCGGGLKWQIFSFNNGYNYKNSISTGNFFLLSSRLAQLTGNKTYSEWAEKSFKWTQTVGLMSKNYQIYDGTDEAMNCTQINRIQWSTNAAIFLEGASIMYNLTNGNDQWKSAVTGLANASSVFRNDDKTILSEVACEKNGKCSTDQKANKGIAARSFARASLAAPFVASSLQKLLQDSAQAAAAQCSGDEKDVTCGLTWYEQDKSAKSVKSGGLGEAFSALEVVQALLYPKAQAVTNKNSNGTTSPSGTGQAAASGTSGAAPATKTNAANTMGASWVFLTLVAMFGMVFAT